MTQPTWSSPPGPGPSSQQHHQRSSKRNSWILKLFLESDGLFPEYFKCRSPHQPYMEGVIGNTGSRIDPSTLSKWPEDVQRSILSTAGHTQRPNQFSALNASRRAMDGDAGTLDIGLFEEASNRKNYEPVQTDPRHRLDFSNPDALNESINYLAGTFSPLTAQSSNEESLHSHEAWTQYPLPTSMSLGMPVDSNSMYSYAKSSTGSGMMVDDGNDYSTQSGYTDAHASHMPSFQGFSPPMQYSNEAWSEMTQNLNPVAGSQFAISPPIEARSEHNDLDFSMADTSVDIGWMDGADDENGMRTPSPFTSSFHTVPANLFFGEPQQIQPIFPEVTPNSFLADDSSVSLDNNPFPVADIDFTSLVPRQIPEKETKVTDWTDNATDNSDSEVSPTFPKVSGYMVSEDSTDTMQHDVPQSLNPAIESLPPDIKPRKISVTLQPASVHKKRKQRNSGASAEQVALSKPLQIVQEDGLGGAISSEDFISPPRGARRKGPLSTAGRANAGLRRKNKDTCVQCRLNKRKCDGNSPCDACQPTIHEQPCARACFSSIVDYGTCNYISQRAINHPTLQGASRVRMEIPSAFNLTDLLSFLEDRRGHFNIRASQSWGSLYVLDLAETYKFLKALSEYNDNVQYTFLEFIDHRLVDSKDKAKNWLSCLKDCDPNNNTYALLSQWNNMPSRAFYSFVSTDDLNQNRPMDVSNPEDRREILLAAQLSRIFCRMLEVEGFRKLERDFYNIKWKRITLDTHVRFLSELGHILLSLRWRVSWWKRLGDGGQEPDPSKQHYVDRVELLCRILYVYYTNILAKLPSWSANDVPKGVWSTYADAEREIWDDFPFDSTEAGFQNWMHRGKELIEEAGVPGRISTCISKV